MNASKIKSQDSVDKYPNVVISCELEEFVSLISESKVRGKSESVVEFIVIVSKSLPAQRIESLIVEGVNQTIANSSNCGIVGSSKVYVIWDVEGIGISVPQLKLSGI
jgi:hypothetical protein